MDHKAFTDFGLERLPRFCQALPASLLPHMSGASLRQEIGAALTCCQLSSTSWE